MEKLETKEFRVKREKLENRASKGPKELPEKRVIPVWLERRAKPACLDHQEKMEPLVPPDQTEKMVTMEPRENQVKPGKLEKPETRAPKEILEPLE